MIRSAQYDRRKGSRGFSMLELVMVVATGLVIMAIAIPSIRNVMQLYSQRSVISSVTGAIQATRYQAIFQGCQYQLVFNSATSTYTSANKLPAAGTTTCAAAFTAPGPNIPFVGTGNATTLGGNITLQFFPNGTVTQVAPAPGGAITMTINYPNLPVETISVSQYGKILVTP
jgi:type II secretory pathway pseudopilin PulG